MNYDPDRQLAETGSDQRTRSKRRQSTFLELVDMISVRLVRSERMTAIDRRSCTHHHTPRPSSDMDDAHQVEDESWKEEPPSGVVQCEEEKIQISEPNMEDDENGIEDNRQATNQQHESGAEGERAEEDRDAENGGEHHQDLIEQRFRRLAMSFRERAHRVRRRFDLPPTPSTISSDPEEGNNVNPTPAKQPTAASLPRTTSTSHEDWMATDDHVYGCVIESQSCVYITWLTLVTLSYLYNCFVIPLRTTFPYQTAENTATWLALDFSMDAIYLLDVVLVKPRIMYLEDGFWVRDIKRTYKNYVKKLEFKMDLLAMTPLDLFYIYIGPNYPLLRVPRLLKIHSFWEFFNHFDKVSPSPYVVRVARTLTYMVYLVHMNACAYYAVSLNEGLGSNSWVFNGVGNAYIRCIYFAVKTATSIGKNPRPENEAEYLFMTACWLMGVFVFALLIGQIRDIIASATRAQTEYRKMKDETLNHLRKLNLPHQLIERVKTWFSYTWQQQHTLDEARLLDTLPHKMKTDVAINVHIQTLNKVQLFKDCDEALLRELVLKLRPVLYLPGDYICRKGEVGREMYIVKNGRVQVVTGADGSEVLATLTEGSVFGEISLLSISGGNRRTADVRSNGFSNLFVLNKDDLNEALVFHPNAQEILRKKARQLVRQNAAREKMNKAEAEVLIQNPEPQPKQPKLLPIVMKVLPPDSGSAKLLKYGSKSVQRRRRPERQRTTHNGVVRQPNSPKKVINRCHSVELGELCGGRDLPANNTFQCQVTVHREMTN